MKLKKPKGIPVLSYSLKDLSLFQINSSRGTTLFGINQLELENDCLKKAGCAVVTAGLIYHYLLKSRGFENRLPLELQVKEGLEVSSFNQFLQRLQASLFCTRLGTLGMGFLERGLYATSYRQNLQLKTSFFRVNPLIRYEKAYEALLDFITASLLLDRPLAFQCISSGKKREIQSRHMVTIVGLEFFDEGLKDLTPYLVLSNHGKKAYADLKEWYRTAFMGGVFASFEILERC